MRFPRFAVVLLAALLPCIPASAPARTPAPLLHWLLVSDVHFDPFADKALVDKLAAAPVAQWRTILATGSSSPNTYGTDTNGALLESSLAAMEAVRPAPSVVLFDGDLLAHRFRERYDGAASDRSEEAFDRFVDKTTAYIALRFAQAFPAARIFPSIGNDDSYCGDYRVAPRSEFLARTARTWAPLAMRGGDERDFIRSFSEGGHYAVDIPGARIRLVVANSVYWSTLYENRCDGDTAAPGLDELQWLRSELARSDPGEHTWVMTHIPPGIDVFLSLHAAAPKQTYTDPAADTVPRLVAGAREPVTEFVAGHFHYAGFRLIPASGGGVPILELPAITPVYGEAPAFLTALVSPDSGRVVDYTDEALAGLPILQSAAAAPTHWELQSTFSSAYGLREVSGASVAAIERRVALDPGIRARYFETLAAGGPYGGVATLAWEAYRCGAIALSAGAYTACLGRGASPDP